ncbi:MAG: hypothetical protein O7E54_14020 [Planctomycetota bacterium]|jgi:4-carboxymuconolactone decarboxylase|nr:hypothetical protein [Planctomycetota bacterium]
MARIEGVHERDAGLLTRAAFWFTKRKIRSFFKQRSEGLLIEPIRIHAHQPRLIRGLGGMEMAQAGSKSVEDSLKALVVLKAAMRIGCPF